MLLSLTNLLNDMERGMEIIKVHSDANLREILSEKGVSQRGSVQKVINDEDITIYVEATGIRKDEISIKLEDNLLTVKRVGNYPDDYKGYRASDIDYSLRIGKGYNGDNLTASLENGVLVIVIPRAEGQAPRQISIQ